MATVAIQVTTTVDEQSDPGVGCSLREAINSSNNDTASAGCMSSGTPSENQITFSPALGANPTIDLNGGLGHLEANTNDLTITGPATVNGDDTPAIRVLLNNGIILTLTSLTISNGNETTDGVGGGIRANGGSLFLNNSTVSGNSATRSSASNVSVLGGGIYSSGQVTLNNSTVANNQASATYTGGAAGSAIALGGGVQVESDDVTMDNSVVSGNQVLAAGNGSGGVEADGGGVRTDGEALIEHSTISGNLASATATGTGPPTVQGGGLLFHGFTGSIDVELSTIANNLLKAPASTTAATQRGGGINDFDAHTSDYISNTIVGNGLDPASQTAGVEGLNFYSAGSRNFANTIVANPVGSAGTNCFGNTPYSTGGDPNVDFPQDMTDPCFTPGSEILNVDPQLGALGNNGGATPTMLPANTSPVIDQGTADSQNDLTEDQRGLTRPVNFPGIPSAFDGSDIGSVEVQLACAGQSVPGGACPVTPVTPVTSAPAGPTGQRAAALAKCKKKKTKKKRKKCRASANKLPV
jgi:CSLREA domain-containing protein